MWWNELKVKQMELAHQERLKCLERGQSLPDAELAWVATVRERGQQLTAIMIVGTLALMGAPVAGTAILLSLGRDLPAVGVLVLLAILWCAPAFVLLCLARHALAALSHVKRAMSNDAPPHNNTPPTMNGLKLVPHEEDARNTSSEAIKTSWFGRPVAAEDDKKAPLAAERTAASDNYLDDRP